MFMFEYIKDIVRFSQPLCGPILWSKFETVIHFRTFLSNDLDNINFKSLSMYLTFSALDFKNWLFCSEYSVLFIYLGFGRSPHMTGLIVDRRIFFFFLNRLFCQRCLFWYFCFHYLIISDLFRFDFYYLLFYKLNI